MTIGQESAAQIGKDPSAPSILKLAESLPGFNAVEELIQSKFRSDAPLLSEISQYLFELGGKRIRPVMTLMTGALFGLSAPPKSTR